MITRIFETVLIGASLTIALVVLYEIAQAILVAVP